MMKVLIITTVRFRFNGITSVIMNYYRNMDKTDMTMDFVVPNEISNEYREEIENNNSRIYKINRKGNIPEYMMELYQLMKNNGYDIVHIHGNSSTMLIELIPAVLAHIPVRMVHSHNTTCSHLWLHRLLLPVFNKCYTEGLACGYDAGKWLYGEKPFFELKNGIDLQNYKYNEEVRKVYRKKINAEEKIVIGHVGNFIEQKNHEFLIDAFASLIKENGNYLLLLISDGFLLEQMQKKAIQLGIEGNILFLGKTMEVPQYMQAMDLFVLPSLHEGLPVVLIEAQAEGLPCIVSKNVSAESDITHTLDFEEIDDTRKWVDKILYKSVNCKAENRTERCKKNQELITEAGYNVCKNAKDLKHLYEDAFRTKR